MCANISKTTATGSLKIHLQNHGLLSGNDEGQWRLDNRGNLTPQSLLLIQEAHKSFEAHPCEWMICTLQPFYTVEQHTFVKMVTTASSSFVLPSARSI